MTAIRVLKFEVFKVTGDQKAIKAKWRELAGQVQEAVNCTWQTWLCWHVQNGTPRLLRKFYAQLRQWHETKRGPKPKCDVKAINKSCAKAIYDAVADACPDLHASTRELARNITQGKITAGKASNGNLPRWHAILLCRESIPSSTRKQPIPFTKKVEQTRILPPDVACQQWRVTLRLDRQPVTGKRAAPSVPYEIELITNRRGIHGHTAVLKRIIGGSAELCGSSLVYDDRRNKWFVHVCVRDAAKEHPKVNPELIALLVPMQDRAWALVLPGDNRPYYLQGDSKIVEHRRRTMLYSRWGRQENYRYAQRGGKGHGVDRAMDWKDQFARDWRDLCTTLNHDLTSRVIRICQERAIGKIVYCQPEGWKAETRLLATVGKVPGRRDSSGWAWYQVASQLQYKTEGTGIVIEVRKWDRRRKTLDAQAVA